MASNYYSLGFTREDGDFELIATLNNSGDHMDTERFKAIAAGLKVALGLAADVEIELLERQDAPDIVAI